MKPAHKNSLLRRKASPLRLRNEASWKVAQSRAKTKEKTRLALVVITLILLILFVGNILRIAHSLFKPLTDSHIQRQYLWDGSFRINLVVRSSSISVLSFDPTVQQVKIVRVPMETYVNTPGDFGSWQLRAIYDLGGSKLLKDSLANFFTIPIDGYLELGGSWQDKTAMQMVESFRQNPLVLTSVLVDTKTDLTPLELLRLFSSLRSVRFDKINEIDLGSQNLLEQSTLPDGTTGLIVDPIKIDGFSSNNFIDSQIVKEQATIAVLNGTDQPGLAQKVAQIISHLGGNVIIANNAQTKVKKSFVYSSEPGKYASTLNRLSSVFAPGCPRGEKCAILSEPDLTALRAQINLILGEDLMDSIR